MHQGAKSKSGWYYRKRKREKLGIPILTRGGQPGPRKPPKVKVPKIKIPKPPKVKVVKIKIPKPPKPPKLKRPRGRPTEIGDLLYMAESHGWVDEDSINNKR